MVAQVHAEQLALPAQPIVVGSGSPHAVVEALHPLWMGRLAPLIGSATEERGLSDLALVANLGGPVDGPVDHRQQDAAVTEAVARSAAHQRLEHAPVEIASAGP